VTPDEARAHEAALEAHRRLAAKFGLNRPYFFPGPQFGTCPGGAEYDHGMSLTRVHLSCCERWDQARAARELEAGS
jgi:hypothetical protein